MNSHTWRLQEQHFLLPKSGHELAECEDVIGMNPPALRYAIADGATEAFDSQTWAQRLVQSWVHEERPALTVEDFGTWAAEQGEWLHSSWSGLHLSWYSQEKSLGGSFAAFVGLQFDLTNGSPRWNTIALGDSCLVHCRGDAISHALPIADYQHFNATPLLVPSLCSLQETALSHTVVGSGTVEPGDVFLLLSDAAAAWYLMMRARQDPARAEFEALLAAGRDEDLARFFHEERTAGRIKDDDIAVIRIVPGLDGLLTG